MAALNTVRVKRQNAIIISQMKHVLHFQTGRCRPGNTMSWWECLLFFQERAGHCLRLVSQGQGHRDACTPALSGVSSQGHMAARWPSELPVAAGCSHSVTTLETSEKWSGIISFTRVLVLSFAHRALCALGAVVTGTGEALC